MIESEKVKQPSPASGKTVLTTTSRRNYLLAIACMLASGFGFAVMNVCIRLSGDLPVYQKTIFRNGVVLFIALFILYRTGHTIRLPKVKNSFVLLFLRALFGLLGVLANFYAVDHIPVADASMLNKLSPFFAILFSFMFLKERVRPVQIMAVLTALIGATIVVRPSFNNPAIGAYLFALMGGMLAGAAYTIVRTLTSQGVTKSYIIFFFAAFSTVALLPFFIHHYVPMSWGQFACLIGAGLGAALGQYGITYAYSFAAAREVSIFDYAQVVFASLLAFAVLGECPDLWSLLGFLVIFSAALFLFIYNRRRMA